jgi:glycerol dehydrogenase-like iron-containing ADH family enzyme
MSNIITQSLGVILLALATAASGGLVAMLPKIWVWLTAKIHGEKVLLLRQTLESRAIVVLAMMNREGWGVDHAVHELAKYVKDVSLPVTIRKLKLSDDELVEMARSAFLKVLSKEESR